MTVNIAYAEAGDGSIVSTAATYADARAGAGALAVDTAAPTMTYGQEGGSGAYTVREVFARFAYTVPADAVVTSAALRFQQTSPGFGSQVRHLEARQYDYGAGLGAADFRSGTALGALPLLAEVRNAHTISAKMVYAGSATLRAAIAAGSSIGTVVTTNRVRLGSVPVQQETGQLSSADTTGTATDPALVFVTSARSTLFGVLGAQVRQDDGSWLHLTSDGAAVPSVLLRRRTSPALADTIAALPIGTSSSSFAAPLGWQSFALATNGSNRAWVVGVLGSAPNVLAVQRFEQDEGGVWSAGPIRSGALPAHAGAINGIAVDVIDVPPGEDEGLDLLVMVSHGTGTSDPTTADDTVYAILSGPAILSGSGSIIREVYSVAGTLVPGGTKAGYHRTYAGEIGSALEAVAEAGRVAYVSASPSSSVPGDTVPTSVGRLDMDGIPKWSSTETEALHVKDSGAKVRILPIMSGVVAVLSVDPDTGRGIVAQFFSVSGLTWTPLAPVVALGSEGIASMPAPSALSTAPAWDAVYDSVAGKVWVYYAAADRTIRRTGISTITYAADKLDVDLGVIGAAGSTNVAIRVQRNALAGASELISVANRDSGGTLSTVYPVESLNVAPTEPELGSRQAFDATAPAVFPWGFRDPNPGDAQSAYQLQIVRVSDGFVAYNSGKIVSGSEAHTVPAGSLSNGIDYQWRVMTWDAADAASPWSAYGTFTTSAGGTVTITDPAVDYPVGVITDDYLIKWSVAGTSQVDYRVILVKVIGSETISDTGWVTSTSTQHTVSGMLSDTDYDVQVQVRNGAGVASNLAVRRIAPHYSSPEAPEVTLTLGPGGGYVLVEVSNPPPTGDRPQAAYNEIFKRVTGGTFPAWVRLATVPLNGGYADYEIGSGVTYEYRARAVV